MELREFERGHEIEPASPVPGVAGGKELHRAVFIRLDDQDALVARVLDDLRRARKAKEPLHAVKLQARAPGQALGGEMVRLLEARETESRVQGKQIVALEVLDEGEERHLLIGDVELLVCGDGAEALCCRFILVLGGREQTPEGFKPPVTGDDLIARADLADGDGWRSPWSRMLAINSASAPSSIWDRGWCGFWSRRLSAIRHVGGGAKG